MQYAATEAKGPGCVGHMDVNLLTRRVGDSSMRTIGDGRSKLHERRRSSSHEHGAWPIAAASAIPGAYSSHSFRRRSAYITCVLAYRLMLKVPVDGRDCHTCYSVHPIGVRRSPSHYCLGSSCEVDPDAFPGFKSCLANIYVTCFESRATPQSYKGLVLGVAVSSFLAPQTTHA